MAASTVSKRRQRTSGSVDRGQRINIKLSREAYERLGLHALLYHKTPGELLTDLITSSLREFHVRANPAGRSTHEGSATTTDSVSPEGRESPVAA